MHPEPRAVSALFQVFGGEAERIVADARECSTAQGMHLAEYRVFSILIPLTVFIATGVQLAATAGVVVGWLLALPASFILLSIIPLVLRVKLPQSQWRVWCTICLVWAIFHCEHVGLTGLFSYIWIAVTAIEIVAGGVLAHRRLLGIPGTSGIVWRILLVIFLHAAAVVVGLEYGWLWGMACGAAIATAFCWAVLNPGCHWLGPVSRRTEEDEILITIDDGPDPHDTPILLDLLDRYHIKAIFFMIGEKVLAHPELACEVVGRGHEIGNHTLTHPQASFWCAGPWRTWREIEECQKIIAKITGIKPRWFRAPVGHRNLFTHPVAGALGLRVMAWNRRGYDAVDKDAAKVLSRILPHLACGDIVLIHEATPIAVEVLTGIISAPVKF